MVSTSDDKAVGVFNEKGKKQQEDLAGIWTWSPGAFQESSPEEFRYLDCPHDDVYSICCKLDLRALAASICNVPIENIPGGSANGVSLSDYWLAACARGCSP